jgi:S-adenosylmethionine hydrolase
LRHQSVAIVTFTTDFGSHDGYAGAMKGVVLSLAPDATLVDITHGIDARDITAGALALAQAAPFFPPGTIHVAVVDPGVGAGRAALVVEAGGSLFVGPDNGLLSLAAARPRRIFRIQAPDFRRQPVSPTFHGRDVFAPTAGRLAAGAPAEAAGPAQATLIELELPPARQLGDETLGTVIHIDAFGNLVTSLTAAEAPAGALVEIVARGGIFRPARGTTFADVEPGALVAYLGSDGKLEIALRDGSAASALGAVRGDVVRLRRPS